MDIGSTEREQMRLPGNGAAPVSLRILTLNLGLLGFRFFGTRFIPLAEHVAARLAAAPALLSATQADVIVLQEIYDKRHRRYLSRSLRRAYPYAAGVGDRWSLFSNGLMVLSRYPIVEHGYVVAPGFKFHERRISKKGYLEVEMAVPGIGPVRLIDLHLTVSGMFVPSVERMDSRRRHQEIDHLLELAGATGDKPALLVGDFNCSPDIHGDHYRRFLDAGYVDSFVASGSTGDGHTWLADNALNRDGPYRNSPSQRIDHVLVPKRLLTGLRPMQASVVLNWPLVAAGEKRITLSDHYGMMVDLVAVNRATALSAGSTVGVTT
jgi:endonuclease/exonuclease/phosphatase family metal-dependent hydrolase